MIDRLLGAVQFLTIIPVRSSTTEPGRSALFFPVVGALLGAIGGLALEALRGWLPVGISTLLILAFWTLVTGGLHEDGFADVVDAFRAWRSPEKIHEILKDSRIGAHGAIALILLTLIRWQSLTSIVLSPVAALAATLAISRTAIVALVWVTPPAGSGSASRFAANLSTATAVAAVAQGFAFAFLPGPIAASWILGASATVVFLARAWFLRRIGGVTGDCLGATSQVVETICLVLFTCRPCMS